VRRLAEVSGKTISEAAEELGITPLDLLDFLGRALREGVVRDVWFR